jgi:hypothetical protein
MSNSTKASTLIKAILAERNPDRKFGYSYDAGFLEGTLINLADIPGVVERLEEYAKMGASK